MRNLAANVQLKHIDLIMASQPYLFNQGERAFADTLVRDEYEGPDLPSLIVGMETFNRASKAIAAEFGAIFVDLEAHVPKSKEYFVDDFHYTPKGNRVIAEQFHTAIVTERLVEKKLTSPQL
jgi:hypothetical protein